MVIDPDISIRNSLRQLITHLGYGSVVDASDNVAALQKLEQRGVTHIIFDARKSVIEAKEFMAKAVELDQHLICIPTSAEPSVDDVFDLLVIGARGYLVKPFNEASVDDAIVMATKGEALSESILYAKNRNEALSSFVMTSLDRLATILRQATQFETAKTEVPKRQAGFRRAVDIGRTFAKGGDEALLDAIIDFCLERSSGPATRLGRLRKRLEQKKPTLSSPGPESN